MWDFVVFRLMEFDVIIGMDWLVKNQVFLDCERKRVFKDPCKIEMGLIF